MRATERRSSRAGSLLRIAVAIFLAAIALAWFVGCVNYRHQQFRASDRSEISTPKYTLRFIEIDDEGWFWEPAQATDALEMIRKRAKNKTTVVVTFIHGWHHSAECCDTNLEGFKETLERVHDNITSPRHRKFLADADTSQAHRTTDVDVIGIYVAWRGRSLWGLADYLSFWGRKGAAERVGETDFREFIGRLHALYLEHHPEKRQQTTGQGSESTQQRAPSDEHFFGMVTVGHSFGAQVLLRAVSSSLELQLRQLNPAPAYLRGASPATPRGPKVKLDGFGDLLVLVNPAIEAAQYHRLHLLAMGLDYDEKQTPVMLTFGSVTDYPRHRLFTLGRFLGEIFTGRPRLTDHEQKKIERTALGVYKPHFTHQLVPLGQSLRQANEQTQLVSTRLMRRQGADCTRDGFCRVEFLAWRKGHGSREHDSLTTNDLNKLRGFDFSRAVFGEVSLEPTPEARHLPYQPMIVAEVSDAIIKGHNGIFTEPFIDFLVPYVTFLESKIYVNLREEENAAASSAGAGTQ